MWKALSEEEKQPFRDEAIKQFAYKPPSKQPPKKIDTKPPSE